MARKRQTKKKNQTEEPQSAFWPLAGAILLMVLAMFLLLGGFGTGGPLPKSLFHGVYWGLGWAAYLMPIALIYLGAAKFISEDRQIPLAKLISMTLGVVFSASWFYVAFAKANEL